MFEKQFFKRRFNDAATRLGWQREHAMCDAYNIIK